MKKTTKRKEKIEIYFLITENENKEYKTRILNKYRKKRKRIKKRKWKKGGIQEKTKETEILKLHRIQY